MNPTHAHVDFAPVLVVRSDADGMEDIPADLIDAHQKAVRELSNTTVAILHHLAETGQNIPWAFRADAMGVKDDPDTVQQITDVQQSITDPIDNPPPEPVTTPAEPQPEPVAPVGALVVIPVQEPAPEPPALRQRILFTDDDTGRHHALPTGPRTRPPVLALPGDHPTTILRRATAPQPRTGDETTGPIPVVPPTAPTPYRRTLGDTTGAIPVIRDSTPTDVPADDIPADVFQPGWWARRRARRAAAQQQS